MTIHDTPPLVTVESLHSDGPLALYKPRFGGRPHLDLGDQIVTSSDTDLVPLAKAILNAVEPEALVENQKDAEPEPYTPSVGDRVQWLGFIKANAGESSKPIGSLGTVEEYHSGADVVEVEWDDDTLNDSQWGISATTYGPNVGPAPVEPEGPTIAEQIENIKARLAALEAAADDEIRVGDTVKVLPADWNIGGGFIDYRTVTGEVLRVIEGDYERYHVKFTYPVGHLDEGKSNTIWAYRATKVAPRG